MKFYQDKFIDSFVKAIVNQDKLLAEDYTDLLCEIAEEVWRTRDEPNAAYSLEQLEANCKKLLNAGIKEANPDSKAICLKLVSEIYETLYNCCIEEIREDNKRNDVLTATATATTTAPANNSISGGNGVNGVNGRSSRSSDQGRRKNRVESHHNQKTFKIIDNWNIYYFLTAILNKLDIKTINSTIKLPRLLVNMQIVNLILYGKNNIPPIYDIQQYIGFYLTEGGEGSVGNERANISSLSDYKVFIESFITSRHLFTLLSVLGGVSGTDIFLESRGVSTDASSLLRHVTEDSGNLEATEADGTAETEKTEETVPGIGIDTDKDKGTVPYSTWRVTELYSCLARNFFIGDAIYICGLMRYGLTEEIEWVFNIQNILQDYYVWNQGDENRRSLAFYIVVPFCCMYYLGFWNDYGSSDEDRLSQFDLNQLILNSSYNTNTNTDTNTNKQAAKNEQANSVNHVTDSQDVIGVEQTETGIASNSEIDSQRSQIGNSLQIPILIRNKARALSRKFSTQYRKLLQLPFILDLLIDELDSSKDAHHLLEYIMCRFDIRKDTHKLIIGNMVSDFCLFSIVFTKVFNGIDRISGSGSSSLWAKTSAEQLLHYVTETVERTAWTTASTTAERFGTDMLSEAEKTRQKISVFLEFMNIGESNMDE